MSNLFEQMLDETEVSDDDAKSGIVNVLLSMPEEDREGVLKAMRKPVSEIGHDVIARVLQRNGYPVSIHQVRRFRNRQVRIPKSIDY